MLDAIKMFFVKKCNHLVVKNSCRRVWENRCDCCNKVLFLKEDHDFNVEGLNIKPIESFPDVLMMNNGEIK